MPAFDTRTSIGPSASAGIGEQAIDLRLARDVGTYRDRATTQCLDLAYNGGGLLAARPVVDHDIGAAVGEAERDAATDAAATAGDDGDTAIEGCCPCARSHRP
jgi:hypothetical protein